MITTASTRRQNMWTTMCKKSGSSVDNKQLSTAHLTTQVQDVASGVGVCEVATLGTYKKHPRYPQSTGLITVIKSSYKHPHLTIHNATQGAGYEI
jgi:hypothetical protein